MTSSELWTLARRARFYVLSQPGPLTFVLQARGPDGSPDGSLIRISLGAPHSCSCSDGHGRGQICIHIAFLLVRRFRLPEGHPYLSKNSLTDLELEYLLDMRHLKPTLPKPTRQRQDPILEEPVHQDSDQVCRERNPIGPDDSCPICIEVLINLEVESTISLPFCAMCGNSFHPRCIQMFLDHTRRSKANLVCPYCRGKYIDGRTLVTKVTGSDGGTNPTKSLSSKCHCERCEAKLGPRSFKQIYSSNRYCTKCFITLTHGSYELMHRRIVTKPKREDPTVARAKLLAFYRQFSMLQYREITPEDHDLLMNLENPYMLDISKTPQRFPTYLVWHAFDECTDPGSEVCLVCYDIRPSPSAFASEAVSFNYEGISTLLKAYGELVVSPETLKTITDNNVLLQLSCKHVVHKICAVVGSLVADVNSLVIGASSSSLTSDKKAVIFGDYCTTCRIPFLIEWLRGSKLSKPQARERSSTTESVEQVIERYEKKIPDKDLALTGVTLPSLRNGGRSQGERSRQAPRREHDTQVTRTTTRTLPTLDLTVVGVGMTTQK
ncbi:hypothetical protein GMRT_11688 [Giardia muris]|uniref:Uncharacterized protein n=1 Tax=Giardia muris TaxID=5742 RepID=A0A4Z1T8R0_GIAMU|nr:hypothetical protein GMRT_11688 [Giardia muris]|eukprot:TNJ29517.1 hypothetical protein GMRT_11688 [Giardia muris]